MAASGTGEDFPLLAGNTPRRTIFIPMKDLVHIASPICAPTPAHTTLIFKEIARPVSVIVVTPSTLVKTARSPGERNRPTHTHNNGHCNCSTSDVADENCERILLVHLLWPGVRTDFVVYYILEVNHEATDTLLRQCNVCCSVCSSVGYRYAHSESY